MAVELFQLFGTVSVDTRRAERDLRNIEQVASRAGRQLDLQGSVSVDTRGALSSLTSVLQVLPGLGVAFGAAGRAVSLLTQPLQAALETGVRYRMFLEDATLGFETMLRSADKARDHLAELRQFANITPFEFKDVVQASQRLQAMGFAAREIIPILRGVGDAVSALGGDAFLVERVTLALGQMQTKGRVSAEEMMQLTEAGIPAWEMLARAIGKTTREVMQLAEQGRLRGDVAARVLAVQMSKQYQGLMERRSQTTSGLLSTAKDYIEGALGTAVTPIVDTMRAGLNFAIKQFGETGALQNMAESVSAMMRPAANAITGSLNALSAGNAAALSENFVAGLAQGLTGAALESLSQAATRVSNAVIDVVRGVWQIESPSRVAYEQGRLYVEGLEQGMVDRASEGFRRWARALARAGGEAFIQAVEDMARRLGANPAAILNVMAFESGFNAQAVNPRTGASGLLQFMPSTARRLGYDIHDIRRMSALEQVAPGGPVERYFQQFGLGKLISDAAAYAAVAAGRVLSDTATLFRQGSLAYAMNRIWDLNRDARIQQWELGALAAERGGFQLSSQTVEMRAATVNLQGIWPAHQARAPHVIDVGKIAEVTVQADRLADRLPEVERTSVALVEPLARIPFQFKQANEQVRVLVDDLLPSTVTAFKEAQQAASDFTKQYDLPASKLRKMLIAPTDEEIRRLRITWDSVASGFEETFAQSLDNALNDGQNFFSAFVTGFGRMLEQLAAQAAAHNLAKLLFGYTGEQKSAGGGIIGTIFSAVFGSLFGSKIKLPAVSTPQPVLTAPLGSAPALFPGRAGGGPVEAGGVYLVGERGPELFMPRRGGRIMPLTSAPIVINFHVQTPTGQIPRATQEQIARQMLLTLDRANRR
jgi:tape measure domain-containing protein